MRDFGDRAYAVSPEVRRLTQIVDGDAFKQLERESRARATAEAESSRRDAVADMESADAWLIAETEPAQANIREANQRVQQADREFQQARRAAANARAHLAWLRQECDRRKMVARRVLYQTVPQALVDFEKWLKEEADETEKRLRTWKETTGFLAKLTGQQKMVERSNGGQVAERLAKIREARDWATRFKESGYLSRNDLDGELQEWRRAIRAVWIS